MDAAGAAGPPATFVPQRTQAHVLCCLCGASILPNPSTMCVACIRSQVDITEALSKQITLLWCPTCERYLQPPKAWVVAAPESAALLAVCVRRVRGLSRVRLIDAGFIWTEPHSRRLKVKLTVQAEVVGGATLQQGCVVEYVVEPHQCLACTRAATNADAWVASVQVRQHVGHKRTFFYLEQAVLRARADAAAVGVRAVHGGLDFHFASRAGASKFVDFVQSTVPSRHRADKQLVSHNTHTSTYNYKYTFSLEIAPVCRDDLVFLPPKLAHALGGLGPLVLVTRVTAGITLTDPATLREAVLDATQFWRAPFRPLLSSRSLAEYVVLDVEPVAMGGAGGGDGRGGASDVRSICGEPSKRYLLADVTLARKADFGVNDRTCVVRSHLGAVLRAGDEAVGYDLATAAPSDAALDAAALRGFALPDAVLVRKSFAEARRRRRARGERRPWVLKRLAMEAAAAADGDDADAAADRARGRAAARAAAAAAGEGGGGGGDEADMERFMQELEEDAVLRSRVALYRDPTADAANAAAAAAGPAPMDDGDASDDGGDGDVPSVPLEELLDDLEALDIDDGEGGEAGGP